MLEFIVLAQECAPNVDPRTLSAIVKVESAYNPYAIGVVGGYLKHQPKTRAQAIATAKSLEKEGWNFSVGLAQVNRYNFKKYNVTYETAFEPCNNLSVGSKILEKCYKKALNQFSDQYTALLSSFSCYYSGNFHRGFKPDKLGSTSYVQRVLAQYDKLSDDVVINDEKELSIDSSIPVVPAKKYPLNPILPDTSPVLITNKHYKSSGFEENNPHSSGLRF